MPQMAPLNWLTLFLLFILIFMMFNSLNYFMFSYMNSFYTKPINKTKTNWKW